MTSRYRAALLAGTGLLLLQLGWILSVAPHYGIDEFDHALRASSVAQGHWHPGDDLVEEGFGRGDLIPVRSDVADAVGPACRDRSYTGVYNCQPARTLTDGEVLIASSAARYNPAFYAVVGTLAAPWEGNAYLYALRAATAAVGAALLATVLFVSTSGARSRWPAAVVLVAALPTTVYSASIASPNGIEMIAGLGVWATLLRLTEAGDGVSRRATYVMLGLFTAVLVNFHTLGALWLVLTVVVIAVLRGAYATVRALRPRTRTEVTVAVLTSSCIAFELLWVLVSGNTDTSIERTAVPGSPWGSILNGIVLWPLQAIGAFPLRDNEAPLAVYAIVLTVLCTVAVLALRRTRLRSRTFVALALVATLSYLVPTAMTVITYADIGSAWQGRYGMPFTAGLLLIAGQHLDRSRPVPYEATFVAIGVAAVAVVNVICQWQVVLEQRSNADLVNGTGWVPPGLLLLVVLGVVAATCWVAAAREPAPDPRSTTPITLQPAVPHQEVSR